MIFGQIYNLFFFISIAIAYAKYQDGTKTGVVEPFDLFILCAVAYNTIMHANIVVMNTIILIKEISMEFY